VNACGVNGNMNGIYGTSKNEATFIGQIQELCSFEILNNMSLNFAHVILIILIFGV